jgi:poly-gamma-glutamate synthesis protein (capsule biosynthesis protein)
VVSIANNHMLDAGEQGLFDTMESLWRAGVGFAGGGRNLEDARRPFIIERNGLKIAFLGYAHFINVVRDRGFARSDRSGLAPMDPFVIKEDIRRVREQVDYVAVAIHWGMSDKFEVYPENRKLAHEIIDAGADLILGGHPPNPVGIEVYKGKVIIYSPGHLLFGYNRTFWKDDHLVRITLTPEKISRLEILPIAGEGNDLAQPYLLSGSSARQLLDFLQSRMAMLGTRLDIEGDIGVVTP